jgi:hypothetical protein
MAYDFTSVRNPVIKRVFDAIFNVSTGHDHDGTNSKAVTTGTVADLAVTNAKLAADVKVGSLATLTTTEVASVVGAINELDAEIGDMSSLTTTATDVAGAINEVDASAASAISSASAAASEAASATAAATAATAAIAAAASLTGTETLSGKTLTAPKIVTTGYIADAGGDEYLKFVEATTPVTYIQISSGDTGVAPKVQGAGETNTDLHLLGSGTGNVKVSDGTDPTKLAVFELNGATTAKATTFAISHTDDRTITFPDATCTLVGANTTDALSNKTLTLPKIVTTGAIVDAGGDEYLKFVEATTPVTYIQITSGDTGVAPKVQAAGEDNTNLHLLGNGTGNVYISDGTDPTKDINFELNGATTAKTMTIVSSQTDDRALTLPDATDTLVGKATTDTLTNKTLTAPTLTSAIITGATISSLVLNDGHEHLDVTVTNQTDSGATLTIPDLVDSADTMVVCDLAQTLTNKTIDSASNPLKNVVQAYAGNITRAEMIAGKTLVAAAAGRTIRVLNYRLIVNGAFNGGAGTSFVLQDTDGTPVVITTALKAALTDGARISSYGLAIANVTDGAGLTGNLTAAAGIEVAADAAWDAGTSIDIVIEYMYV